MGILDFENFKSNIGCTIKAFGIDYLLDVYDSDAELEMYGEYMFHLLISNAFVWNFNMPTKLSNLLYEKLAMYKKHSRMLTEFDYFFYNGISQASELPDDNISAGESLQNNELCE